jgi:hypothetical protein
MTKTYTIKPLAWEKSRSLAYGDSWQSHTILGNLAVFRCYSIKQRRILDCFTWTHGDGRRWKTPKAAQAAAESWYRERLLPALTPSTN